MITASTTPTRRRRSRIAALTVALTALSMPMFAGTADAAPQPPAGSGWARFGHFAPGQSAVDVYVDGAKVIEDVEFKTVSAYVPLPEGPHEFQIRATGDSTGDPILTTEAGVPNRASVTIGAVATRDGIAAQVYTDTLVQPPADGALVRFIHAAPDVEAVTIGVVGGPTLVADVPYPAASDYQPITPGTYDVEVRSALSNDVVLKVNGWTIDPGVQATIVIVRGADGQLDVAPVRDAVAVPEAPVGGVQTGGGSMADALDPLGAHTTSPYTFVLIVSLLALCGLVGTVQFRRRRLT